MRARPRIIAAAAIWLGLAFVESAAADAAPSVGEAADMNRISVTKQDYRGWPNTYLLTNGRVEARVVTDVGPRIIDFRSAGGDNVLYLRESEIGRQGEADWVFRGGWRFWVAPETKETTYALDNSPCQVEVVDGDVLRVTGPAQPSAGIRKQIDVRLLADAPHLQITARLKNVSDHPVTYAAWSLPVLRPGGRAFVPLDKGSLTAFDSIRKLILWSYAEFTDPRYRFGDRLVEIDSSKVKPAPAGQSGRRDDESKIGVDTTAGWAAYLVGGTLFLKRFPHDPHGQYIDGGATVEVYSSAEFLELENLGPLTTIAPGQETTIAEDWWLRTGVTVPTDEAAALSALEDYVSQTRSSQ
jgi:uncharacterized protein DUF4380